MSEARPDSPFTPSHELSVPEMVYPYKAGVIGGALGGLAMVVVAVLYGLFSGQGLWLPVNLIGATFVRNLQGAPLAQLVTFNASALLMGLALHMIISVILGLLFSMLLPTLPGSPLLWAILIGPLLWTLASVLILPMLNPVMAQYVDHGSFLVAHIVYSVVLGLTIARTPKVKA